MREAWGAQLQALKSVSKYWASRKQPWALCRYSTGIAVNGFDKSVRTSFQTVLMPPNHDCRQGSRSNTERRPSRPLLYDIFSRGQTKGL